MHKKFLSSDGFEKWLNKESVLDNKNSLNKKVYPKIKFSNLIEKIEVHDGDAFEIAKCFRKNGGIVKESGNNILTIETKKGTFCIEELDVKYKFDI